jgi:hypothetical protein
MYGYCASWYSSIHVRLGNIIGKAHLAGRIQRRTLTKTGDKTHGHWVGPELRADSCKRRLPVPGGEESGVR